MAYFFSRQLEQRFGAVLDILTVRDEMDHDSMVLPMLYGMEPEKTELCIFIPFLEKVFQGKDEKREYRNFLQYFYPFICYDQGDVNGYFAQEADSSIYQFIAERYGGVKRMIDGSGLPVLKDFVEREQGYSDGSEVSGRSYVICVEEAYRRKSCDYVVEMLENETFPLKKEYHDVKKLYLGLKVKYGRKTGKASFRSRFH